MLSGLSEKIRQTPLEGRRNKANTGHKKARPGRACFVSRKAMECQCSGALRQDGLHLDVHGFVRSAWQAVARDALEHRPQLGRK